MTKINDIEIIMPDSKDDVKLFSVIKHIIKDVNFGKVEFVLTIRNGKVENVQKVSRGNFKL